MPSNRPHIILIDGKSGVGKTTLATVMADSLNATLVHLDDSYPGWDGLAEGSEAIVRDVVIPVSESRPGSYTEWDWANNRSGETVSVQPNEIVIVEGCGISTPLSRSLADTVLWVDCDESTRLQRLAGRDGEVFTEEMKLWDRQVEDHIAAHDPIETATLTVAL